MDKHLLSVFAGKQDEVSVPRGPGTLPHSTTRLTGRGSFSGFPMNADPAPYMPCLLHLAIWVRPDWTHVYLSRGSSRDAPGRAR